MITKLNEVSTAVEAIRQGGLDWNVSQHNLITTTEKSVESHKAIVRDDSGDVIGIVGKGYQPIQNTEAFAFFDTIVGKHGATYEKVGQVKGGRKVFVQAKLDEAFDAQKGDQVDCYLTLLSSHDGSSSFRVFLTPLRIVCLNQLTKAIKGADHEVKLRHTSTVESRISDALNVFNVGISAFSEFKVRAEYLAKKQVSRLQVESFLDTLVPTSATAKHNTRTDNKKDDIKALFENGKGNRGRNAWELYNAATEYVDYKTGKDEDKLLDSALFGAGANFKGKAFEAALAI